ncbi:fungal-specific transcription factor domain-containing protein [Aspergillus novoparasiticus]|uniref:Fungal-specific transcription factor domain-containing protein n=1 Tax=Aspergillus novoparasiticus TaxID=986946 RepID=A0A5N6F0E7_9EURO|nr:fungal-specific transcription factor domain-containing protein [Aspergillus novoparasiticus]
MRPRRQARAQARAACSTCKHCRLKKIKCDGQLPKCGVCFQKNQHCEYPQDGRKTAVRAKRKDVDLLQKQIQELKDQAHKASGTEDVIDGNSSSTNLPSELLQPEHRNSRLEPDHELKSGTVPLEQILGTPRHEKRPGFIPSTNSGLSLDHGSSSQDNDASPWNPRVDSDISGIQAYGVTNLRHRYLEHSSATTHPRDVENGSRAAIRDQLISFSAISRQKEHMLYYTPSMAANIDFDGVPMDTAMHLLDLHWNRLHLMYLLTYRPAFMDSLLNNGPYVNKLLMNAIYIQSSLYSDRKPLLPDTGDPRASGMAFYGRFKSLLVHYIDKPDLPTVVALLLCGACLVQYGKQSAGWVFCGMAYRMIFDLGYHLEDRKPSHSGGDIILSPLEREIRRRVYWGAYATDKSQSLYFGQNPALYLSQANVPREFLDSFEELEEWKPYIDPNVEPSNAKASMYRGRPSFALSTFECLLRLSVITESVIGAFYSTGHGAKSLHSLLETRQKIMMELDEWRSGLPSHLSFDPSMDDPPPPHQMTLFTTYWTLVILTQQPFTTQNRFGINLHAKVKHEAMDKCVEAAFNIRALAEAYQRSFTLRRAQFGISYAMYSAVLILLQSDSQGRDDYTEACRFFWSALVEYQKGCGSGLKKPLALLKSLMLRVTKLAPCITDNISDAVSWSSLHVANLGTDLLPGTITLGEDGVEDVCQFNVHDGAQHTLLDDDTIFGFFTDGAALS